MAEIKIKTTTGKASVDKAAKLYKDAFRDDPVIAYMLCNLTREERHTYLYKWMTCLMIASAMNGGVFDETEDFSTCLVTIPPGKRPDNVWTWIPAGMIGFVAKLGLGGFRRMLLEFEPKTDAMKRKAFGKSKKFWYVFFNATREDRRGRGLSTALMQKAQGRAAKDGLPLWLEATTAKSTKLYLKLGFEVVDTISLGEGQVDSEGQKQAGGGGVPVRGMVWWPPKNA
ncbi:hypothetical protein LTR86_002817 [Recurvomyces mirabilis]|nr:hypothetical protein LTR86_002817 [Recurvomyces mirabilis]